MWQMNPFFFCAVSALKHFMFNQQRQAITHLTSQPTPNKLSSTKTFFGQPSVAIRINQVIDHEFKCLVHVFFPQGCVSCWVDAMATLSSCLQPAMHHVMKHCSPKKRCVWSLWRSIKETWREWEICWAPRSSCPRLPSFLFLLTPARWDDITNWVIHCVFTHCSTCSAMAA